MTREYWGQKFKAEDTAPDQRHHKLLQLCERAVRLVDDDEATASEKFHILLNDLAIYARAYFNAEEERLRQANPQLLARHQQEYIAYEQQLTDLLMTASQGILDRDGLLQLLSAWSAAHLPQSGGHFREFPERS